MMSDVTVAAIQPDKFLGLILSPCIADIQYGSGSGSLTQQQHQQVVSIESLSLMRLFPLPSTRAQAGDGVGFLEDGVAGELLQHRHDHQVGGGRQGE